MIRYIYLKINQEIAPSNILSSFAEEA